MAQWDPFKWTSKFTPTTQEQYFQPFKTASDLSKERRNDLDTREAAIDAYKPYLGDENSETYNAWKSVNDKIDQNLNELGHLGWNFNPAIHRELKSEYAKQTARLKGAVEGMQAEQKRADDFKAKNPRAVYNWRDKDGNTVYKLNADLFIDNGKVDFHQIDLEDMRKQGETLGKNISTKVADAIMADTRLSTAYYVKDGLIVSRDHKRKGIGGGFHIDWLVPTNNPEKQAMNKAEIDKYLALHPEDKEILRTLPYLQQQVQSIFDNTDFAYMDKENQTLGMNSVYLGLSQGIGNYDEDYHINAKADPRGDGGGGGDRKEIELHPDRSIQGVQVNDENAERRRVVTLTDGVYGSEGSLEDWVKGYGDSLGTQAVVYKATSYADPIRLESNTKDKLKFGDIMKKIKEGKQPTAEELDFLKKCRRKEDKVAEEESKNFNGTDDKKKMQDWFDLKYALSRVQTESFGMLAFAKKNVKNEAVDLIKSIVGQLGNDVDKNEPLISWLTNGTGYNGQNFGVWQYDTEKGKNGRAVTTKEFKEILNGIDDIRYDTTGKCFIISDGKPYFFTPRNLEFKAFNDSYNKIAEEVSKFSESGHIKTNHDTVNLLNNINDLIAEDKNNKPIFTFGDKNTGVRIYKKTFDTSDGNMVNVFYDVNGNLLASSSKEAIINDGQIAADSLATLSMNFLRYSILKKLGGTLTTSEIHNLQTQQDEE